MADQADIRERMEIVSCDDRHVGYVENVRDGEIGLAECELQPGVSHHRIPVSWVVGVDAQVHLNCTREEARALWR